MDALVTQADVETALLGPLSATQARYIDDLCAQVSNDLRTRRPDVDVWINAWDGVTGADREQAVAKMLSQVIKRYIVNVKGAATTSDGDGPHTHSESFTSYGKDFGATGQLVITEADLATLAPIPFSKPRLGSIRLGAGLAPHSRERNW